MCDKRNRGNRTPARYKGGPPKRQIIIRTGEQLVLIDGTASTSCSATIEQDVLVLTTDGGEVLRLIRIIRNSEKGKTV